MSAPVDPQVRRMPFIDLAAQQARLRPGIDAAIARVLDHGRYVMGPEVLELEAALADRTRTEQVVSCASGTDALYLAMRALGLRPGERVLVPAFTFAATAEAVALAGGEPVFVDVDPSTFVVDPASLADALAELEGPPPVGLVPVDLFGQPADHPVLTSLASEHGLWVVVDAAQSFGAEIGGRSTCAWGDVAATSFFPAKPLGGYGDGGAIFSADEAVADRVRSLRLHGQGADPYVHTEVGITGRLDTLQAAILLQKLTVFDDELAARALVADRYHDALHDILDLPEVTPGAVSAWAQYTIRVPGGAAVRDRFRELLAERGIPTAVYYPIPLHRQAAFAGAPVAPAGAPVADRLATEVVSLPMHPYLTVADQDRVIEAVREAVVRG